jgi:hypothetical protein
VKFNLLNFLGGIDMIFCNQAEKQCWLNRKRQEMEAEGLSENEIEEQIDALS